MADKCKLNGMLLEPCETLAKTTSDYNGHYKKGLSILPITQFKKDDGRADFVHVKDYLIVKNGEFQKNGIACNYCPFCGEKVYPPNEKD